MSKGNTFENDLMKLIFQAVAIANLADDAGADPLTNLYVALHTDDPSEGGAQNANECTYTGYGRVAVERSSDGWDVVNNVASNKAKVSFGECTVGDESATHVSVGVASAGATKILYSGALTAPLAISPGIVPEFAVGALQLSED